MARQVKNTITGELMDHKAAYRVQIGSKVCFFSSEAEYVEFTTSKEEKEILAKAFKRLWISMIGEFNKEPMFAPMATAFEMIYKQYPYKFALPRIKRAFDELDWIREKTFPTAKAKLLYLLKVLTTSMKDDIIDYEKTKRFAEINTKHVDDDIFRLSQKAKPKVDVNCIDQFL